MVILSRRIEVLETRLTIEENSCGKNVLTSKYIEKNLYFRNSCPKNWEFFSQEQEFFSAGNEVESSFGKNV